MPIWKFLIYLASYRHQREILKFEVMKIKGQILITTLLSLTIITLLVASLTMIAGRDVIQLATSERYEQFYNIAETELRNFIDQIGINSGLSGFFGEGECIDTFWCQKNISSNFTPEDILTNTLIVVRDTREIKEMEIKKDSAFNIKLNQNYVGSITFDWEYDPSLVDIAFEVALMVDNGGHKEVLRDVYNPSNILGIGVSGVLFPTGTSQANKTQFVLDLSTIILSKEALWITPRIVSPGSDSDYVILKSATFSDLSNVPYQVREYISETSQSGLESSPVAKVISRIPLTPQIGSLFDNVLLTDGQLKLD